MEQGASSSKKKKKKTIYRQVLWDLSEAHPLSLQWRPKPRSSSERILSAWYAIYYTSEKYNGRYLHPKGIYAYTVDGEATIIPDSFDPERPGLKDIADVGSPELVKFVKQKFHPTGECRNAFKLAQREWGLHNSCFANICAEQYFSIMKERWEEIGDAIEKAIIALYNSNPQNVSALQILNALQSEFRDSVQICGTNEHGLMYFSHVKFGLDTRGHFTSIPQTKFYGDAVGANTILHW